MKHMSVYSTIDFDETNRKYSNVCFQMPDFSEYEDDYEEYTITSRTEYRPDKIAYDFYGDDSLSWVIDEINGFNEASKYEKGLDIYYLPAAIVFAILGI